MKNLYYALMGIALLLTISCGSRKAIDPVLGAWEYVVSGTPDGDVKGTMYIAKEGDAYTGKLQGNAGNLTLSNIEVMEGKMTSEFTYQGYTLDFEGMFEGESFTGEVIFDAYTKFPVKATKVAGS